ILDKDMAELHAAIDTADADAAEYRGGLIVAQIKLRKAALQNTEAMLLQKRKSLLRRINLNYVINAKETKPASADELAAIEKDMRDLDAKIKAAINEAAQYRGGLIQATLLMSAETQKMTMATLQHKYYTAKYGIPMLTLDNGETTGKTVPAGKTVDDKDAL
ncbi:MAG: hypothetical protein K2Q01_11635, partial [Rickettsiales bacterium]|nr:hypothetical protein [Rickettsiales bacterium]